MVAAEVSRTLSNEPELLLLVLDEHSRLFILIINDVVDANLSWLDNIVHMEVNINKKVIRNSDLVDHIEVLSEVHVFLGDSSKFVVFDGYLDGVVNILPLRGLT